MILTLFTAFLSFPDEFPNHLHQSLPLPKYVGFVLSKFALVETRLGTTPAVASENLKVTSIVCTSVTLSKVYSRPAAASVFSTPSTFTVSISKYSFGMNVILLTLSTLDQNISLWRNSSARTCRCDNRYQLSSIPPISITLSTGTLLVSSQFHSIVKSHPKASNVAFCVKSDATFLANAAPIPDGNPAVFNFSLS